jgi:hypothetical protein
MVELQEVSINVKFETWKWGTTELVWKEEN